MPVDTAGYVRVAKADKDNLFYLFATNLRAERFMKGKLNIYSPARFEVFVNGVSKQSKTTAEDSLSQVSPSVLGLRLEPEVDYEIVIKLLSVAADIANMIGLLGFKSPTKDLNVTASLAVMSIVLVEAAGIRKKGVKGWVKSFAEPIPIIAPINVLELFIRPLSLCMRLFGNVLGAVVVMALIKYLLPLVVPLPFSGYFDIFDGVIQAYVFVFLTSLYIKEAIE